MMFYNMVQYVTFNSGHFAQRYFPRCERSPTISCEFSTVNDGISEVLAAMRSLCCPMMNVATCDER